jgi:signal transduction histidine kinase
VENAAMSTPPLEPKWPRLLSLSVHELRTPISVVAGYLRMVLKDPAGTLDERYRRMLEEAEKSCARLSALVAEMSDLSALEAGTAAFKKAPVDIRTVLTGAIDALPPLPDRNVTVELRTDRGPSIVQGDGPRLQSALTSVLHGLRREVVTSDKLIVNERTGPYNGQAASWIAIADAENIDGVSGAEPQDLTIFDEWRGGCGLSLAVARRVIDQHQGSIWSPATGVKTAAVIALPH